MRKLSHESLLLGWILGSAQLLEKVEIVSLLLLLGPEASLDEIHQDAVLAGSPGLGKRLNTLGHRARDGDALTDGLLGWGHCIIIHQIAADGPQEARETRTWTASDRPADESRLAALDYSFVNA